MRSEYFYHRYNYKNKHAAFGMWFLLLTFTLIFYADVTRVERIGSGDSSGELINPLVSTVQASEPTMEGRRVVIECEKGVKEYLNCKAAKGEITDYQARVMYAIARAESGLRPEATNVNKNGSIDRGVFQINSIHKSLSNADAYDWKKNTDFALKLMKKQGFKPWVVYQRGIYKKFL